VGDEQDAVASNRRKAFSLFSATSIHEMQQVHGDTIRFVDATSPSVLADCDALLTQTPGCALVVKHADCQAAILFDPHQNAIAAVHCGWRGSVLNIYAATIAAMIEKFGSNPTDLRVAISPSLGPDAAEFQNFRDELPESFWSYGDCKHYFDFWELSQDQLLSAGVERQNIENLRLCTYSDSEKFFSYRRERVTGRHATAVMLP
jgi:YfiH family protein